MAKKKDSFAKTIGDRILVARRKKGWTQQRLADEVGISRQWVCRIESGVTTTSTTLRDIAEALDLKLRHLLARD